MQSSWSFYPAVLSYSMVFFIVQFSAFVIVPFQTFMVKSLFHADLSLSKMGKETSYLGSAFFLGYIPGCVGFSFLADKFGRRPILLLAIFGNTACLLLFGFSLNFAWALTSRIACGAFGGIISVARTYNAEITDEKTQTAGFAMIGTMSIMGRSSGLVFGGFLSQPAGKYSTFSTVPFFYQFKFLLPCLIGSFFGVFNFICGLLFLKETQVKNKSDEDSSTYSSCDENEEKRVTEEKANDVKKMKIWFCRNMTKKRKQLWRTLRPLFRMKIVISMFLFGMTPLALASCAEVASLLLLNGLIQEGFNLDFTIFGIIVLSSSLVVTIAQVFLYLLVTKYIGYRWTFRLTSVFLAVFLFTVPFSSRLMKPLTDVLQNDTFADTFQDNSSMQYNEDASMNEDSPRRLWLIWLLLGTLQSTQTLLRVLYTTGTLALFGSATKAKSRSLINGIGQSFCGTCSIITPFVSGPLHKWSKSNGLPWPLNYHFPFELVAAFVLTTGALSFLLPASVDGERGVSKSKSAPSSPDQNSVESDTFLSSMNIESDSSDVG